VGRASQQRRWGRLLACEARNVFVEIALQTYS